MNARKAKALRRAAKLISKNNPDFDERRVNRLMKRMETDGAFKKAPRRRQ